MPRLSRVLVSIALLWPLSAIDAAASTMPPLDAPPATRWLASAGLLAGALDYQLRPGTFVGAVGMYVPGAFRPNPPSFGARVTERMLDLGDGVVMGVSGAAGVSPDAGNMNLWTHVGWVVSARQAPVRTSLSLGPSLWAVKDNSLGGGLVYNLSFYPIIPNLEVAFELPWAGAEITLGGNALLGVRAAL